MCRSKICVYILYIPSHAFIYLLFYLFITSARLVWALWALALKLKNERHRLQISPWLPAPELEIDTFPAAFVELCYLLAPNQLLSHALIFRNRAWYTISRPRQTHSRNPQNHPTSHSIRLPSFKEEFALKCAGNQTLLSDKTLRSCANISKVFKLVSHPSTDCFDICFPLFFLCTWMLWKSN